MTARTAGLTLPATAQKHAGMLRTLRYLPGGCAQGVRAGAHLTVSPRATERRKALLVFAVPNLIASDQGCLLLRQRTVCEGFVRFLPPSSVPYRPVWLLSPPWSDARLPSKLQCGANQVAYYHRFLLMERSFCADTRAGMARARDAQRQRRRSTSLRRLHADRRPASTGRGESPRGLRRP